MLQGYDQEYTDVPQVQATLGSDEEDGFADIDEESCRGGHEASENAKEGGRCR